MVYPVEEIIGELTAGLSTQPLVILQAPPGAGKSTVLPLHLLKLPWTKDKKIIMLEPRRLAAKSVAVRLASSLGEQVGATVGYRVRFERKVSGATKLEIVTEGILTRMLQADALLEGVGMIIFDEFHERSLDADLAMALTLYLQRHLRPDLKILIMSATLDTGLLSQRLGDAPIVKSAGRVYPVSVEYVPGDEPIIPLTVRGITKALREREGDILVFLPGAGEISRVATALEEKSVNAIVTPLYGDLPYKLQQEAILPDTSGRRKIVLASSIAETSLTIEGITTVVDSGLSRVPKFNPRSGFTRLETVRVTRDSADQRAGRAGRLGPGFCYRLWSTAIQSGLVPHRVPEIAEADLASLMLTLKHWGVDGPDELEWVTEPPAGAIAQAIELLHQLKALENSMITDRGRAMAELPAHPRIAHMLIEAKLGNDAALLSLAIDLAAVLDEKDPLSRNAGADITLRVNILRRWRQGERVDADRSALERIEQAAKAWRQTFETPASLEIFPDSAIGKLLLFAYPERLAKQIDSGRYRLSNGRTARLPDYDLLETEKWLVVADLDEGQNEGKIFLAAPVNEEDLLSIASERTVIDWDDQLSQVSGRVEKIVGGLVVSSSPLRKIDEHLRAEAICNYVARKGLSVFNLEENHRQWQARVLSLRAWRKEEPWPDVSDESLKTNVNTWLLPFLQECRKASDLLKLDLLMIWQSMLPWELQQKMDALAPARLSVPSGSSIKLQYFDHGQAPVMEVRLQEVFGLSDTPAINEGRTKVVLHLLSPGYKPVQVTQDLKSFWNNTYSEVRKELRSRYPRHSWPEDPWTAEAVRGVKRRS